MPSDKYLSCLLRQYVTMRSLFAGFITFWVLTAIISLNSVNWLVFVKVKCGVFFAVRTEFLYII
jgi:hypothetical protein